MEVSLEKVQYKFASIIGELCSQPVILSQFAVWLDLRLAEYKAKGSISLDCSGDKPDPVWLNGLKSSFPPQNDAFSPRLSAERSRRKSPSRSRNFDNGRNQTETQDVLTLTDSFSNNHTNIPSQHEDLRDSSSDFIIKQEPDEDRLDIFPTGLHAHGNRDGATPGSISGERRKRRSAAETGMLQGESGDMESSFTAQTPAKVRKTGDSPYTVQESSNQSLMSIIGVRDFSQEATPVSLDDVQRDIDLVMAVQMQENQERMAENSPQSSFISSRSLGRASSTATRGDQGEATLGSGAAARSVPEDLRWNKGDRVTHLKARADISTVADVSRPHFDHTNAPFERGDLGIGSLEQSYANPDRCKRQTERNTSSAVGILQRWLWEQPFNDRRPICEIPPATLDLYLVEFFSMIKKRDGKDYTPESLFALRTSLERYLSSQSYPVSIIKSAEFIKSQVTFSTRIHRLREANQTSLQKVMESHPQ